MLKTGLFGGTFDPPHKAHGEIAKKAMSLFSLDRIIFIPAGEPPHKREIEKTPKDIRLKMTELMAQTDDRFTVSKYEIELDEPCYSLNTVKHFKKLYKDDELYFIIGGDSLKDLPLWWNYRELMEITNFIVIGRPGVSKGELFSRFSGDEKPPRIFYNDELYMDVSSTDIRRKIQNGEDVLPYVLPEVLEIIQKENLYKDTRR